MYILYKNTYCTCIHTYIHTYIICTYIHTVHAYICMYIAGREAIPLTFYSTFE